MLFCQIIIYNWFKTTHWTEQQKQTTWKKTDEKVAQKLTCIQCRGFGHIPSTYIAIKTSSWLKCCTILKRKLIKCWWWWWNENIQQEKKNNAFWSDYYLQLIQNYSLDRTTKTNKLKENSNILLLCNVVTLDTFHLLISLLKLVAP